MARSLILSPYFDAGEGVIGLSSQELVAVAKQIQAGTPYRFDSSELARVTALHEAAKSIAPTRLLIDGLRWLLPPAVLLLAFAWVIWHQ